MILTGATDDLAACAVLLEVLRIISVTNTTLRHDLVFLFNGAEENILQASHGFITQHKWAKNLIAVVNMDACGAGGRELLFQVGPNNPWLVEVSDFFYAHSYVTLKYFPNYKTMRCPVDSLSEL